MAVENSAESRFIILINMYRGAGIPFFMPGAPKIFYIYSTVMALCAYGTWLGILGDIIHNYDDFDHLSESVRVFIPITCAVTCDAFFRLRRKHLERIMKLTEHFTWNDVPKREPLTGHHTMATLIPVILSFILFMTVTGTLLHGVYCIFRLSMHKDRILTLNAVYPFNHIESPIYELTNLSQYVAVFPYAFNYYGFGGFFATMIAVSCSQFEKLKISLLKLREDNSWNYMVQSQEEQTRLQSMKQQLTVCIHTHQKLIRFVRELEEATSKLILLLFTMISLGLCFSAFSTVMKLGHILHHTEELILSGANFILLFCLCWFGTQLTQQVDEFREAVWGCGWVGAPIPVQRNIAFLIAMTSKELVLTAGSISTVSLTTSQAILQQSYSFLMFMLNMHKEGTQ